MMTFFFVSSRFSALAVASACPAPFDASCSPPELRLTLAQCVDSAVGLDGPPILSLQNQPSVVAGGRSFLS